LYLQLGYSNIGIHPLIQSDKQLSRLLQLLYIFQDKKYLPVLNEE